MAKARIVLMVTTAIDAATMKPIMRASVML